MGKRERFLSSVAFAGAAGLGVLGYRHAEQRTVRQTPLQQARAELHAAADAINPDQHTFTLFGYRLEIGKQDPEASQRHLARAQDLLGPHSPANSDIMIAQESFAGDASAQQYDPAYTPDYTEEQEFISFAETDLALQKGAGK